MSIFKPTRTSHLEQPMFLGEAVDVARYDVMRYPWIDKLTDRQLSFFWRPEEIDLTKDAIDFRERLTDNERHVFTSNLKYQTLLDSVQGRAPTLAFGSITSLPELETWIQTWAFSECLAEGTEVLTAEGWKDLADTTTDDSCLVYDLQTEAVFFENPKRVVEYDMDTTLVEYRSKNPKQFHQLVTPNHRMPVVHRQKNGSTARVAYFNEAILQDYKPHHMAPISGHLVTSATGSMTPLERLLVAAQADGSVQMSRYNGVRCGTIPVWFGLAKKRKIERLQAICAAGGIELLELTTDKRNGVRRFKANIPAGSVLGSPKRFDWIDLTSISGEWCTEFLFELSQWDSHRYTDDALSSFTYYTTVKDNADVVQAIATMCGRSPRLTVIQDARKASYKDTYSVNVVTSAYKDGQSIERRLVPYKGKVRCLETSTGAFVIRYNGVVSVTGNTIHSRSYTHIIRNVYTNPSEVLDTITITPEIIERADAVTKDYDNLIRMNAIREHFSQTPATDDHAHRKAIFRTLASVNVLEAIRFYVSFACSFSFAERSLMEGNAKIIKLIARDEALHLSGTQLMLQAMMYGDEGEAWQKAAAESLDDLYWLFDGAVQQEKDWAAYLFKDGSILGLNEAILGQYVEYIANVRLKALGLSPRYATVNDPLPWMKTYLSNDNVQVAPQETEITSYLTGAIDSNIDMADLGGFTL